MSKSILVIVVTYNGKKWINRCFDSVVKDSGIKTDLLVVDNSSTDNSVEIIKSQYPNVVLIESKKNLGFGAANNLGLDYAIENNYDYVYLLNQDAWLMPDTLEKLIEIHHSDSSYGILSPLQTNAEKNRLDRFFSTFFSRNEDILSDCIFGECQEVYNVDFVMAAHWLISRECLLKVGKFSPVFFHYGEDDNYLHRIFYHGFKAGIVPSVIGVHDREFRELTQKKDLYFLSVLFKIVASNINESFIFSILKAFLMLLATAALKAKKYKNVWIFVFAISHLSSPIKIFRDREKNKQNFTK